MRITLTIVFCLLLAACAGGFARHHAAPLPDIALVVVENPDFCIRRVETRSDFAVIRPDYQTVLTQGCTGWDGMGNAPVVWVRVEVPITPESRIPPAREFPIQAIQSFDKGSAKLTKPAGTLKDFAEAAKAAPETKIYVVGHVDPPTKKKGNPVQLARKRAVAVANWLQSQGIAAERIVTSADLEIVPNAVASMTIVVTGGV